MMKKLILIILLITAHLSVAQNYKFGKVSKEELQETAHSEYPEADAAILYKKQRINFDYQQNKGFVQNNYIHQRIKIYTKEGFDYANQVISLYVGDNSTSSEDVLGLKAYTYNLEGGKIQKVKLQKDGIFEEELNKYRKLKKFTMPNISEGCIVEFEYTVQSQLYAIDDIGFQQMIPTKRMELTVVTPEYLKFSKLLNPRASYIPLFQDSKGNSQITITSKTRASTGVGPGGGVTQTVNNSRTINYKTDIVTAELDNIPPLKDENYVDNLSNYQAKLIMELQQLAWPGEPVKNLSTSWEKVTKTIYKYENFGDQLRKKSYYKKDIDALLSGVAPDDAYKKTSLIFNHVKSKVKWNDYYGYTADEGVTKAYKDGVGNIGDINLMLTSMLRYAGLNANPVLISTKANGIPITPSRNGFNYVVSAVNIDGNRILLDASKQYNTANILPTNTLNWLGRLVKEDGNSDWINLIPKVSSKESVSLNVKLHPDLSASGKVRHQFTNYQANSVRNRYGNATDETIISNLQDNNGNLSVSELSLENIDALGEPVSESYTYNLPDAMEDIGGNLYVKPLLFLVDEENPFKQDARVYPIDFVYPIADKYMVNMMLPEGYAVESLPESVKYQFNVSDGEFTYIAKLNGNFIQFIISLDLNKTLILPEEYEQFKEFYQLMIEKQNEQVVLKKV